MLSTPRRWQAWMSRSSAHIVVLRKEALTLDNDERQKIKAKPSELGAEVNLNINKKLLAWIAIYPRLPTVIEIQWTSKHFETVCHAKISCSGQIDARKACWQRRRDERGGVEWRMRRREVMEVVVHGPSKRWSVERRRTRDTLSRGKQRKVERSSTSIQKQSEGREHHKFHEHNRARQTRQSAEIRAFIARVAG